MSKKLPRSPDRIFIDATYTICSGKNSGIERVVRNIVRESCGIAQTQDLPEPSVVVSQGGKFFQLTEAFQATFDSVAAMQSNVLRSMPGSYCSLAKAICGLIPTQTTKKWLLPKPGHLGIFKTLHTVRERASFYRLSRTLNPIAPTAGDMYILPDAYWVNRLRNSVWPAAADARKQGATVATVIYDLIPLTHPEFVGLRRRDAFYDYLVKATLQSDLLLAISNTVLQELQEFIHSTDSIAEHQRPALCSFPLGAELKSVEGDVRAGVQRIFAGPQCPYLMVATFDPRKNHHYLLDAFEILWNAGNPIQLCLVGRFGSRCDDLVERITSHPYLGSRLHLFVDLSDAELQHCYRNARGVIFPSIVEGFGLPIVESLWFGNKTFVSDTPIHREVGGGDCCYFSLASPRSLADELERWENILSSGTPALPTRRPVSWHESVEQLFSHCLETYQQTRSHSMHTDASLRSEAA